MQFMARPSLFVCLCLPPFCCARGWGLDVEWSGRHMKRRTQRVLYNPWRGRVVETLNLVLDTGRLQVWNPVRVVPSIVRGWLAQCLILGWEPFSAIFMRWGHQGNRVRQRGLDVDLRCNRWKHVNHERTSTSADRFFFFHKQQNSLSTTIKCLFNKQQQNTLPTTTKHPSNNNEMLFQQQQNTLSTTTEHPFNNQTPFQQQQNTLSAPTKHPFNNNKTPFQQQNTLSTTTKHPFNNNKAPLHRFPLPGESKKGWLIKIRQDEEPQFKVGNGVKFRKDLSWPAETVITHRRLAFDAVLPPWPTLLRLVYKLLGLFCYRRMCDSLHMLGL